jgi:hypothetical protein
MLRLIQLTDEERTEQACRDLVVMYREEAAHEMRYALREAALELAEHFPGGRREHAAEPS